MSVVWKRIIATVVLALSCVPATARSLPQDVYIWQRAWTSAVVSALDRIAPRVAGFRVLAAESDAPGRFASFPVAWSALEKLRRPVTAVVRIDGQFPLARQPELIARIAGVVANWRSHGLAPAGLEIDYDCATSRLSSYAAFLARLRATPGLPHRLSVTALPAWLGSPALDAVLANADEAVLQVHAVRAPQTGLFDPSVARGWIDAFDARDPKPFRVALPDYGTRIVEGENGQLLAVESEAPKLIGGASATELIAAPADVAALLRNLEQAPPKRLAGIIWFRLPTESDARIWSLETLEAVMAGTPLEGAVTAVARPGMVAGMRDILLVNNGNADRMLPAGVALPRSCRLADGINGYTLAAQGTEFSLRRLQTGLLHAHHAQVVGWMRCEGEVHVEG